MEEASSIIQLESVVEKLIDQYRTLERERDQLRNDLLAKGEEVAALETELSQLRAEREDVHGRVSSLLGKLVEWEQSQEQQPGAEASPEPESTPAPEPPAKLFSMEA